MCSSSWRAFTEDLLVMHELSLIHSLLDQLDDLKKKHGLESITDVYLRVGTISGVDLSYLRSTFDLYIPNTNWSHLKLHLLEVSWRVRCLGCHAEREGGDVHVDCPHCHSHYWETIQGEEFVLQRVEGCSKGDEAN